MPQVSVILPNYNGGKYIARTIESVLKQTYEDLELIVIDDASIDHSREIISSYKDPRIIVKYNKINRHIAYTCNEGLKLASGQYIARIDSDDYWDETKLEKQVEFMNQHPDIGACFTRVHLIDEEGINADKRFPALSGLYNLQQNRSQKEWIHFFLFVGNCLCHTSVLIRSSALDKVGRKYSLAYVPAEDYELWTRLVTEYPIHILEEPLVYCRWGSGESKVSSMKNEGLTAFENVQMLVREKYLNTVSDARLREYFSDEFILKDAKSPEELSIERALLLMKCTERSTGKIGFLGWERLAVILEDGRNLSLLEEKYRYSLPDLYRQYRIKNFWDFEAQNEVNKLQDEKKEADQTIEGQNQALLDKQEKLSNMEERLENMKKQLENTEKQLEDAKKQLGNVSEELEKYSNSRICRMIRKHMK